MQALPLTFECPQCGSAAIFYSCTPNCCFNHVCGDCGATFEPETETAGRLAEALLPPDPLPDSTGPTAGCAKCDATTVYRLPDGRAACSSCRTVLTLRMTYTGDQE